MMRFANFFFLTIILSSFAFSQPLTRWKNVKVIENGDTLRSAFSGGLNQPQFSAIDLNDDQLNDLFVFDRSGNAILPFINQGSPGNPDYQLSTDYRSSFPELLEWAILVDFNCDNKPDLFTSLPDSATITVYENTSQGNQISFSLYRDQLKTPTGAIFVSAQDIPAFTDVDADGDIDILAFDSQGSQVRYFENLGNCDSLDFVVNTNCWGQFEEAGLNNNITLDVACKRNNGGNSSRHAGSSLLSFDYDGDNAVELILGDLNHPNLVYLHNGGDSSSALIDQVNTAFPPGTTPVDIRQFPAGYYLDLDIDGKNDLIVAPNAPNISLNVEQVWYYRNTGSNTNHNFSLQQDDLLVGEMIDVGTVSNPVFFDYNSDGLLDLVIGNYLYRETPTSETSGLTLYENIGTANQPLFSLVTRDYLNLSTLFNPQIFGLFPTFGDLDDDGDQDLVLGDENGNLHYFKNQAAQPGDPADFILFAPFFGGIDVGSSATPQLIDLNDDGLLDLLIGEKSGNLNLFENLGSLTQPFFAIGNNSYGQIDVLPQCCTGYSVPFAFENNQGGLDLFVASEFGELYYYANIDQQPNDTFQLTNTITDLGEGSRISIFGADLDQDQKMDFIVGNRRGGVALYQSDFALDNEEELLKSNFINITPNPVSPGQLVHIQSTRSVIHTPSIEIYNLTGQLIFQSNLPHSANPISIQIPEIPQGLYLVKLFSGQTTISTEKLIVIPGF